MKKHHSKLTTCTHLLYIISQYKSQKQNDCHKNINTFIIIYFTNVFEVVIIFENACEINYYKRVFMLLYLDA